MELTLSPVKQRATALGLPISQPEKIKNNEEFQTQLASIKPDAIIVVGYGRIIPAMDARSSPVRQYQPARIVAA